MNILPVNKKQTTEILHLAIIAAGHRRRADATNPLIRPSAEGKSTARGSENER